MGIRWQDRVTNLEVLDRAGLLSIEAMILKAQLRWTGHVIRMEPHRLPRQLLYGELRRGQRPRGRPRKRFKDCVKDHLKHSHTPARDLEVCAQDRTVWRGLTRKAQNGFESNRRNLATDARERRKASVSSLPASAMFHCPYCPRVCASRIGLSSHIRAHGGRCSCTVTSSESMVYP